MDGIKKSAIIKIRIKTRCIISLTVTFQVVVRPIDAHHELRNSLE